MPSSLSFAVSDDWSSDLLESHTSWLFRLRSDYPIGRPNLSEDRHQVNADPRLRNDSYNGDQWQKGKFGRARALRSLPKHMLEGLVERRPETLQKVTLLIGGDGGSRTIPEYMPRCRGSAEVGTTENPCRCVGSCPKSRPAYLFPLLAFWQVQLDSMRRGATMTPSSTSGWAIKPNLGV